MDTVAVLIPCYNEKNTIEKVVLDFKRILPKAVIYVYDNNSTDGSDKIAKAAGAVVRYEYKQGKGNVIRRMFREIDAHCYVLIDADDTYPVDAVPQMVDLVLNKNADMVVGDRLSSTYFKENKRHFHGLGNRLVRKSINTLFGSDVKDILTGLRTFSYSFVKTFPVLSGGFEIETEMTIHAIDKNMYVENVIIDYRDRTSGESKLNTYTDGIKVIETIFRLYKNYKPMRFFGIIAFLLALLSVAFFIPVFATYLKTGLVPNFPTLIVCGFVMIAAIQCFFSGMILSTIITKEKQNFEFKLNTIKHQEQEG